MSKVWYIKNRAEINLKFLKKQLKIYTYFSQLTFKEGGDSPNI